MTKLEKGLMIPPVDARWRSNLLWFKDNIGSITEDSTVQICNLSDDEADRFGIDNDIHDMGCYNLGCENCLFSSRYNQEFLAFLRGEDLDITTREEKLDK